MSSLLKMRGFLQLTRADDAKAIIMGICGGRVLGNEEVAVEDAWGRVLEGDVISPVNVPPFSRSAVDGYAIRSEESFSASHSNPAVFAVRGTLEAGGGEESMGGGGESYEIYTGAPLPGGADAVVMAEDCQRAGEVVRVFSPVPKFANVSLAGEDIRAGEKVLEAGQELRPWHIGVLASVGIGRVSVRRKVVAGIFATGAELVDVKDIAGPSPKKGSIVDSSRPMLMGVLRETGCEVVDGGIVSDSVEEIASRLAELGKRADMVLTIGGSSVGGRDLVPEAVGGAAKGEILFHGLAVRPGKPTGFGMVDGVPVFMLPGYPVSAMVGYEVLVSPLISRWSGRGEPKREKVTAVMSKRVAKSPGMRYYLRVKLGREGGEMKAEPMALTGSGLLSSVTKADGIVIIAEEVEGIEEGDEVEVELLRRALP